MQVTTNNTDKTAEIDQLYVSLMDFPQVECPLIHIFTPGMYTREIFMPAGTMVVSKIHNTTHVYIVSKGKVAVYNSNDDAGTIIEAPFTGITTPNTRRVLHIIEDTIWTTTHPLPYITGEENGWDDADKQDLLTRIEDEIIIKYDPLLEYKTKEEIVCHS